MNSSVILVTSPDDTPVDAKRILCIDLTQEQSNLISSSLTHIDFQEKLVIYLWGSTDDVDWLLDKKDKSSIILLNSQSEDNYLVGYFASKPNCYYFGNLKHLSKINNNELYGQESVSNLFTNFLIYEKTFRNNWK